MGRQLITVFLPTIIIFRHFLYTIFFKNPCFCIKINVDCYKLDNVCEYVRVLA